ncbi:transposase [Kibdelosporangium philippinense]|uniref:transposase n=1 Tax=Kibdelosporangium philippinense TaxID=211113 RepID=UPI0036189DE8
MITKAVAVSGSVPDGSLVGQLRRLRRFRRAVYESFTRWPDVLFEMVDALLCHPGRLESLPYLSLEPVLRRGHGSVYAALDRGRIDAAVLAGVLAGVVDRSSGLVFALDCSQWPRPDAPTSPDRTLNYDAGKDVGGGSGVVTPGWWFQWLAATGTSGSSWASPVAVARIAVGENHNVVAVGQIEALLKQVAADRDPDGGDDGGGLVPIVCADGDYSPVYLGGRLTGERVQIVVRLRKDAVVMADPPPREPGTIGRPRVHGPKMKLSDRRSWRDPDEYLAVPAEPGRAAVSVSVRHGMHPRASESAALREPGYRPGYSRPVTRGSVVWVCSADPAYPPMWLFWTGPEGSFDLDRVWRAYLRRYGIEHLFRFLKQYLAWTRPRVRGPEQAERWSWLVAVAYVHLVLARGLIADQRLSWERRRGPLSPLRVKRGFRGLHPRLGSPAKPRKPSRPGPGRPTGRTSIPATRHRIVRPVTKT